MSDLKIEYVTIHCSATRNFEELDIGVIRSWHLNKGFSDVGYHYVIQPSGEVQIGRPINKRGAHVKDENIGNIGVCLIGNDKFEYAQFNSLRNTLKTIELVSDWKTWNLRCHYEWPSAIKQQKTCPNMRVTDILHWYLTDSDKSICKYLIDANTGFPK